MKILSPKIYFKILFIAVSLSLLMPQAGYAKTIVKGLERYKPLAQRNVKELQKDINQGYKDLVKLYKRKEYNTFLELAKDLTVKLDDASLPSKYRVKMMKKVQDLSKKLKDIYNARLDEKSKTSPVAKKVKSKSDVSPKVKSKPAVKIAAQPGELSKEDYEKETQSIRRQILQAQPELKRDQTGLAQAVLERKVKLARERSFLRAELDKAAEELYQKAILLFNQHNLKASQMKFMQLEQVSPNYKKTPEYLKKLRGL